MGSPIAKSVAERVGFVKTIRIYLGIRGIRRVAAQANPANAILVTRAICLNLRSSGLKNTTKSESP